MAAARLPSPRPRCSPYSSQPNRFQVPPSISNLLWSRLAPVRPAWSLVWCSHARLRKAPFFYQTPLRTCAIAPHLLLPAICTFVLPSLLPCSLTAQPLCIPTHTQTNTSPSYLDCLGPTRDAEHCRRWLFSLGHEPIPSAPSHVNTKSAISFRNIPQTCRPRRPTWSDCGRGLFHNKASWTFIYHITYFYPVSLRTNIPGTGISRSHLHNAHGCSSTTARPSCRREQHGGFECRGLRNRFHTLSSSVLWSVCTSPSPSPSRLSRQTQGWHWSLRSLGM